MQTFLRRLEILNYLRSQNEQVSTDTILQHLLDAGYLDEEARERRSQLRLIQRDLKFLLGPEEEGEALNDFGLTMERGQGKSLLWRLDPYQQLQYDFERMPAYMALALSISSKHLKQLLPGPTRHELSRIFQRADERLNQRDGRVSPRHYHRLTQAVEFYQRGQSLRTPEFDMAHLDNIYQAILQGKRVNIEYRSRGQVKDYDLHPFGVAIMLPKLYLVAKKNEDIDSEDGFRSFLLHRIESVSVSRFSNAVPQDFEMKRYLQEGHMDVYLQADDKELYELELELHVPDQDSLLLDLQDSPIADDQHLVKQGNGVWLLTAGVQRTVQLRNWLLSLGDRALVKAPACIEQDLVRQLQAMLDRYPSG